MEYIPTPTDAVGYLIVEAKTSEGALPVPGAVVTVSSARGTGNLKLTVETDESGRTERISLPTVASSLSQSYGSPQPYSIYDISVNAEGYYPFRAINVPIFSGVTTLQPAMLIGLSTFNSDEVYPRGNTTVNDQEPSDLAPGD